MSNVAPVNIYVHVFSKVYTNSEIMEIESTHTLCAQSLSCVRLSATPWTAALQVPLSMGILQARILEWVAMPSSRGSFQPRIEPRFPTLQADSLQTEPPGKPIL